MATKKKKKQQGPRLEAGRPPVEITPDMIRQVELMAGIGLSQDTMAAVLGISSDTFTRRKVDTDVFRAAVARGRGKVEAKIANVIYTAATTGNLQACIWMEKTRFNRAERVRNDTVTADLDRLTDEQLARVAAGESLALVVRG